MDVLVRYLTELSTPEVKVKVIHAGVGGITEGDVVLAQASDAIIIGFNVVPEDRVRQMAENLRVDIRLYNVIYRITEDLKACDERASNQLSRKRRSAVWLFAIPSEFPG